LLHGAAFLTEALNTIDAIGGPALASHHSAIRLSPISQPVQYVNQLPQSFVIVAVEAEADARLARHSVF
jgi:hypothetical protein